MNRHPSDGLPIRRTNDITVIVGKKGAGKSTKAREIVLGRERRIIIDPMWEHSDGVIVRTFQEFIAYVRPLRERNYAVVLQTLDMAQQDAILDFLTHGQPEAPPLPGVTLMIDEADKLCSAGWMPDGLSRIVNYGRHFGVSLIALSRRPRRLARDITANADHIYIFQTQEPRDVDYFDEFIGERLAQRAKRLRLYEFVVWPDDLDSADNPEQGDIFDEQETDGEAAAPTVPGNELHPDSGATDGDVPTSPRASNAGAPGETGNGVLQPPP